MHSLMNSSGPIALLLITASVGGLLFAWLRARRRIAALEAQLADAGEKLRLDDLETTRRSQLDTVRNEFISTVSHELRTPLTSIRGALGLLSAGLMGSVDAKANKLLRIAITNTDRLIRLVNDILDLERLESGRAPLQLQRCLLGDLVTQAMETMSPMADAAGVKLVYTPPASSLPAPVAQDAEQVEVTPFVAESRAEDRQRSGTAHMERRRDERRGDGERRRGNRDGSGPVPLYFDGESDRILQVLLNLLSNSIKFSPPNTTVTIYVEASPDLLQLRVSDEGRGIPQDKLETIFDRFQQVDAADAREKGGTGLGLAICRSIIQQHGGAIWAQRNPTAGASLCVDLPRSNRSTDRIPGKSPQPLSPAPGRDAGAVLVCDDDPGIRTVVTEHLRRRGYTVVETSTGEQALEIASRQKLSAILLDLYMPGLDGWETLQKLKEAPATANIPVVILSVLSSAERPAMVNGAQGWVQKPFNENFLFSELGRVLRLS